MAPPRPSPDAVPSAPGVYRFSGGGQVLYVGKAKQLRRRLLSYFRPDLPARTARMVELSDSVDWVVCASETEALTLEREWISARQPPFNIRLREGDGYAGLWVSSAGAVPRLGSWRGRRPSGVDVFGPYPGVRTRELLDALGLLFKVRTCTDVVYRQAERSGRPCLLADTGHCSAPCVGRVEPAEHRAAAVALSGHLRRPDPQIRERIEAEMRRYADEENFEAAARRRDQLDALALIGRAQRVLGPPGWDRQLLGLRRGDGFLGVAAVIVAEGAVVDVVLLESVDDPGLDDAEILELAAVQLTERGAFRPGVPVIAAAPGPGRRSPRGDRERAAFAFADAQAEQARVGAGSRSWAAPEERTEGLADLAAALGLHGPPQRIECIDISHTGGRQAVGSLVVIDGGTAANREFRHVKLGNTGGDDYAAIAEVVRRRFTGRRMGLSAEPDLLLIDGGRGQIASAQTVLDDLGVTVPAFGLAKRLEEIWPPGASEPVVIAEGTPALRILQHARDQAHRTALRAHRRGREQAAVRTLLDDVPGLGPARRRALIERYGSLDALLAVPAADLAATPGIGPTLAAAIAERLAGRSPTPGPDDGATGDGAAPDLPGAESA